jgi:uncharacterized protein YbjT (DUF2867 family)
MLAAHHLVENILQELPDAVSIKTMRPVGFYYNMFSFIPAIRAHGSIASNYSAAYKEPVVSHFDIADVVAREMELPFEGRTIRYIASDEVTTDELVKTLGEAIGEPALRWEVIPDGERLNRLLNIGVNPVVAKGLVEMDAGRRDGILYHDYFRHRPVLGKVKLADFAKEFAAVYNNSKDK